MVQKTAFFALALLASSIGFAQEEEHVPMRPEQTLGPAAVYNGNTPVDRSHGLIFNNGTFGLPNTSIEEWAKAPVLFPNLSEKTYSYDADGERKRLISSAEFLVSWGQAAIVNYEHVSADTRPEAIEHAKQAKATLEPTLGRLEDALSKLKSAGSGDWASAQENLRRAVIDFRLSYTQMHKNVRL